MGRPYPPLSSTVDVVTPLGGYVRVTAVALSLVASAGAAADSGSQASASDTSAAIASSAITPADIGTSSNPSAEDTSSSLEAGRPLTGPTAFQRSPGQRFWLGGLATQLPLALTDNDFRTNDPGRIALGRLLFHDPVLSGNRNIACATCHHDTLASADGQSLGVGEGGTGLGAERRRAADRASLKHRVPRHSPALFNLGAYEFTVLFHDGRVAVEPDEPSGFTSPAGELLPEGLSSVLSAQALFPLLSEVEMAGASDSNEVAGAAARRSDHGWREIENRLRRIDAYLPAFNAAWPAIRAPRDITIAHVAEAIDAFISSEWRATNSPFDHWLAGDARALDADEIAGAELFYGKARCASCHSGPLQTDHGFHALMLPPIGPGRTRAFDPVGRDPGRMNVTDRLEDAYRFRTPSLRNVAQTAPYGHNGSFATLEGIIRHHLEPTDSLRRWDHTQLVLADDEKLNLADFLIIEDRREMARYARHLDIAPVALDESEVARLIDFLGTLTDTESLVGTDGPPASVPSGLPVD